MAVKPWLTSDDLLESVKRKISFPSSQNTFTDEDILAFANEEMMISQVPSVMQFHEEYFVVTLEVPLVANISRYSMPERAIGLKLRSIFWKDNQGNLFDMSRVDSDNRAFFQSNAGTNQPFHKFYLEGNDVVLTPNVEQSPQGSLLMVYFLRPNQLVLNSRAAIINAYLQTITINNTGLVAGDTVTIDGEVFTAVASSPAVNEFVVGATATDTATNLAAAINTNGIVGANNGNPSTAIITLTFLDKDIVIATSNPASFIIPTSTLGISVDAVPTNITSGSKVDFLQTKPGHRTLAMSVTVPLNSVGATSIVFPTIDIPTNLVIGDYLCTELECIIPQIPPDLHNGLAERTSARILAAIGDTEGLQAAASKINEINQSQGTLLDNRVEGNPPKVLNRHSLLRFGKMGPVRRL